MVIGTLLLVALYFGGKKIIFSITHETTDNAQIETSIVPVLTRISGYVKTISIRDYDSVGQNQLVAEIDDAELQVLLLEQQSDLQQSMADVSNAQAQLENGILSLKNNKGVIDLKTIKQKKANSDLKRDENLFKEQAITRKQLEETEFQIASANQELTNAQTELATANNRIAVLRQNVNRAMALIEMKKFKEENIKFDYNEFLNMCGCDKKTETKEQTMASSSGSFEGQSFSNVIKKHIHKINNAKLTEQEQEIEEITDGSSSGSYDVPLFGKSPKGRRNPLKIDGPDSIYKGRAVKDKNFPKWGGPDSVFVKVKEKCKKFPYCNQGNTGAIEFVSEDTEIKQVITETSKKFGIPYKEMEKIVINEISKIFI